MSGKPADAIAPLPGLIGFTHALRRAGLSCDPHRGTAFLRALEQLDLALPANVYWAGRVTLCASVDDLPAYDATFAAWFTTNEIRPSQRAESQPMRRALGLLPTGNGNTAADETRSIKIPAPSDVEVLRHRDIRTLTAAERADLAALFALLRVPHPRRRTLRHQPAKRGPLDPRRTFRALLANGGEPARLRHRAHGDRPRRVVLLIDVSGSMSPYADALLRFAHVITRRTPNNTEVFTVGTRLTRVSRQLRHRDPTQALTGAANAVPDFAGGTRLGDNLKAFLDRWGQRGMARQATAVIFSDGWERGDPAVLAEQVARLRRIAHAVLWVNPHAGNAGYQPVQSGIAAVLPHVDRLVAGHSLAALESVLRAVLDGCGRDA
jgi:uncharacterized protein with von Willebrand factor type A (vWA) domain